MCLRNGFFLLAFRPPSSNSGLRGVARRVEEWLAEDWEDIPPITTEEVQWKLLEMRALAAPGLDGIMAQCL